SGSNLSGSELVGPRIIETAQLSIVTQRDHFDGPFSRAIDVAARYGGYVEQSSTEGVNSKFGRITLRVPETNFQAALRDLKALRDAGARRPVQPLQEKSKGGIAGAWRDARHGFVSVLSAVIVGLGYLVPITVLFALIWLGLRRLRPRVAA